MTKLLIIIASLSGAIAVAAGAFGAHALTARVTPERLQTFETGVRYQMYHTLAIFAVAWVLSYWPSWQASTAGILFIVGIIIFSGSLYLLVLTDTGWLGAITPIGGMAFIAGWVLFAWAAATAVN